jgi:hypothetical protein
MGNWRKKPIITQAEYKYQVQNFTNYNYKSKYSYLDGKYESKYKSVIKYKMLS